MTNREKYKQAFSALHTSDGFSLEGLNMKKTKRHSARPILVVCGVMALLVALLTAFGTKMPQDVVTEENGVNEIGIIVDGQEIIFNEPPKSNKTDVILYEGGALRLGNGDILLFDTADYLEGDDAELHISMWPVEGMEAGQPISYGYYQDDQLIALGSGGEMGLEGYLQDGVVTFVEGGPGGVKIHEGSVLSFPNAVEYDQIFIMSGSTDTIYIRDIT